MFLIEEDTPEMNLIPHESKKRKYKEKLPWKKYFEELLEDLSIKKFDMQVNLAEL